MLKQLQDRRGSDEGFTLIELLIAIVVIGILSTVVVLGIGGLTADGKKGSCTASLDASKTASVVHFANVNAYPITFGAMSTATPPQLDVPTGVTGTGTVLTGPGWTLTMTPGAAISPVPAAGPGSLTAPTFLCA
jgi:prepilin-type N-terminal cleavage/methylation domain-containing protein